MNKQKNSAKKSYREEKGLEEKSSEKKSFSEKESREKKLPLINREVSWLSFNDRVLQEAEDRTNPLLERLRFLGIYSNNRDEFFRVRVATLKRMTKLGKKAQELLGGDAKKILDQLQKRVIGATQRFDKIYDELLQELERQRIHIIDERALTVEQGEFVDEYFREKIMPSLFPIMLDSAPQFPYLKDKSIYLAIKLERRERNKNCVTH